MSARHVSGFARQPNELYQTPSWVVDVLADHIPLAFKTIWEPACGQGQIVRALEAHMADVLASDKIDYGHPGALVVDFLKTDGPMMSDAIVTNPPYGPRGDTAVAFIQHGLRMIAARGFMALLLPSTFDNASTRADLFENCPEFVAKLVVRKRIMWFQGDASPKENHAWFIWESIGAVRRGPPSLLYGPKKKEATHVETAH